MSADLLTLRAFQALGLTLSAMMAGANVGLSLTAVPPLLLPSTPAAIAAQQWSCLYGHGKRIAPPTAIVATLMNCYVLYRAVYSWPTELLSAGTYAPDARLLTASIVAQIAIIPFTVLFMESGTNARMERWAVEARKGDVREKGEEEGVRTELKVWGRLNMMRGAFPAAGAVLGFVATFF